MENNNLENNIKNSFEQYFPDLNHDEIWDNIEPKLKKKKKRRVIIWFFGGIAALGLLLITTISKKIESVTTAQKVDRKEAILSHQEEDESTASTFELDSKQKVSIEKAEDDSTAKSTETYIDKDRTRLSKELDVSESSELPQIDEVVTDETVYLKDNITDNRPHKKNSYPIDAAKSQEAEIANTPIAEGPKEQKPKISDIEIPPVRNPQGGNQRDDNPKAKSSRSDIADAKNKSQRKKKKRRKRRSRINIDLSKTGLFVQPTSSVILPIRILGSNPQVGGSNYINQRRETERQLEAFGLGLNLLAQNRKGYFLTAGIEFQRLNSKYSIENSLEKQETYNGVISVTVNAQGDVISTTMGPKTRTTTTINRKRYYNHHSFINLPIGVGKIWKRRKYDFRFMSGVDINLYHNFNGQIIGPNGYDLVIASNSSFEEIYKRKTGLSLWARAEYLKTYNKRLSLSIAPKIQIPLNKITVEEYAINQRFVNIGVTLGAYYLLNPSSQPYSKKRSQPNSKKRG